MQQLFCFLPVSAAAATAVAVIAAAVLVAAAREKDHEKKDKKNDAPAVISSEARITHKRTLLKNDVFKAIYRRFIVHSMPLAEKCYKSFCRLHRSTVIAEISWHNRLRRVLR